jgi:hypothetical protein
VEGWYWTSAIIASVRGVFGTNKPKPLATTTVPEEYTGKGEKNTSACTNDDAPDGSSAQPGGVQFSHRSHTLQRLYPYEDKDPELLEPLPELQISSQ